MCQDIKRACEPCLCEPTDGERGGQLLSYTFPCSELTSIVSHLQLLVREIPHDRRSATLHSFPDLLRSCVRSEEHSGGRSESSIDILLPLGSYILHWLVEEASMAYRTIERRDSLSCGVVDRCSEGVVAWYHDRATANLSFVRSWRFHYLARRRQCSPTPAGP